MSWIQWMTMVVGAWTLISVPVALVLGRLLRERDPLADLPEIADEDRRPLPPALRETIDVGGR